MENAIEVKKLNKSFKVKIKETGYRSNTNIYELYKQTHENYNTR